MKRILFPLLSILVIGVLLSACSPAASPTATPPEAALQQESKATPYGASPGAASDTAAARSSAPAGAPATSPSTAGSPGGQAASADRMIINNARMTMEVKDTTDSLSAIGEIVDRQGGNILSNNFRYEGERKVATVTIRVPVLAYEATLAELRRLAIKVQGEDSKAQDVTEEYSDLKSQLRNLEATEAQYMELLKRAQSIDEILKVQARLSDTRREIERIKGRTVYLERTTEMASITVSLFSRDKGAVGPQDQPAGWWKSPAEAFEQSLIFLARIANFFVVTIAFFWWLIILIGAVYVAWRITSSGRSPSPMPVKRNGD